MEHVMVDLETLGRRAGCSVLSIGAVAFDPTTKELGPEFYMVVNRHSCVLSGLHEDADTLTWWDNQLPAAKVVLDHSTEGGFGLRYSLTEFTNYLAQFDLDNVKIWGNGSDFDNAILINCYAAVGQNTSWRFWNNQCYRTLKGLRPSIKMNRQGVHHNALDDAKSQAIHAITLLESINYVGVY